jgi:hypothetical protein
VAKIKEGGETFPQNIAKRFFVGPSNSKSTSAVKRALCWPRIEIVKTLYAVARQRSDPIRRGEGLQAEEERK